MDNNYIEKQIEALNDGMSYSELRDEIWRDMLKEYAGDIRLDAIITRAMEVYGNIILRHLDQKRKGMNKKETKI
jgi:hypothetical protein